MNFIVFEGLEGCGKTTQLRLLAAHLTSRGIAHITTRQPSDNPIGTLMRTTTDGNMTLENETMALLVAADRYQHMHDIVNPALKAGQRVLCDRYYYSSFACQGIDADVYARVALYNQCVIAQRKPDITFFINTSPEECMRRITTHRKSLGMYDSVSQLTAIYNRYLMIYNELKNTDNVVFIDGNDEPSRIATNILSYL